MAFREGWAEHAKWYNINSPTFVVLRASTTTGRSLAVEPFDFSYAYIRPRLRSFHPCFLPCRFPFQMSSFYASFQTRANVTIGVEIIKSSSRSYLIYKKKGSIFIILRTPLPTSHRFIVTSCEMLGVDRFIFATLGWMDGRSIHPDRKAGKERWVLHG